MTTDTLTAARRIRGTSDGAVIRALIADGLAVNPAAPAALLTEHVEALCGFTLTPAHRAAIILELTARR